MSIELACGHEVANEQQPHYCDYLRLHELLRLQPMGDQIRHPDEHFFVGIHQTFEIWFKQILFDLPRVIAAVDADNIGLAIWLTQRIARIGALFSPMIQLMENMAPSDFFAFRACLAPASGAESHQFREIEVLAGLRDPAYRRYLTSQPGARSDSKQTSVWTERLQVLWESRSLNDAFLDLLQRRGVTADGIYLVAPTPNPNFDLFLLAEALLDFDEAIVHWRAAHARVAERAIGPHVKGTGHTAGVRYLDFTTTSRRFFPALWQARSSLWQHFSGAPGCAPTERTESRCPV